MIEELCAQNSDNDLLLSLSRLPRSLTELLQRKLGRVKTRSTADHASQMLQYCGLLKRPLRVDEFKELLSLSIEQKAFDPGAVPNDMGRVVSDCCGLIFVDEEYETVHYVHHSIKKYLFSDSHCDEHIFREEDTDNHLGFLCLTYLHFTDFERQLVKVQKGVDPQIQPVQLGLSPIAQSRNFGSKLAQTVLRLHRQSPNLDREGLLNKGREVLSALQPPQHLPPLEEQFYFLEYARHNWIYHLVNFDSGTRLPMKRLFHACVAGRNSLAFRPWIRTELDKTLDHDAHPSILNDVTDWTLRHRHTALALYLITPERCGNAKTLRNFIQADMAIVAMSVVPSILTHEAKNNTLLHEILLYAASQNSLSIIREILAKGAAIDFIVDALYSTYLFAGMPREVVITSYHKCTALQVAAGHGQIDSVKLLVSAGAKLDVYSPTPYGRSALCRAIENRHIETVEVLLKLGAEVDAKQDSLGRTALFIAAHTGHCAIVNCLLDYGAEVDKFFPIDSRRRSLYIHSCRNNGSVGLDF